VHVANVFPFKPSRIYLLSCAAVLQTLSTALDALQQRLTDTGLQDQAAAVASGRENVTSKVHEAADAVASFVKVRLLWQLHASSACAWC
jgi:hypothetical protein